jgi:hypothetical protein
MVLSAALLPVKQRRPRRNRRVWRTGRSAGNRGGGRVVGQRAPECGDPSAFKAAAVATEDVLGDVVEVELKAEAVKLGGVVESEPQTAGDGSQVAAIAAPAASCLVMPAWRVNRAGSRG